MNCNQPSEEVVRSYCEKFFGYGRWDASVWFVGMEEGGRGCADKEVVFQRINNWNEKRNELEHGAKVYGAFQYSRKWVSPNPPIQATWRQLIRIEFLLKGIVCSDENIKKHQSEEWGSENGGTCLVEMFALPSASINEWQYNRHFRYPFLQNRTVYRHEFYSKRAALLRSRMRKYKPLIVVFYGTYYREYYEGVLERDFTRFKNIGFADFNGIPCFLVGHPVRQTDEYFSNAARAMKDHCKGGLS